MIQKYLSVYAEPEIQALSLPVPERLFHAVLVLPIYDERLESLLPFLEIKTSKPVAMIWVFNCPDNAEETARTRTREVMNEVLARFRFHALSQQVFCSKVRSSVDLYLLDCCSNGLELPAKQGVGLARKLGLDLGLKLVNNLPLTQDDPVPWMHSCDADVSLPVNYFDIPEQSSNVAACLYPFCHRPEPGYELAMTLYEKSLHYYVDRLRWAGSPYAFHTIGSLIVVNPVSYAQVRGVPKRAGAEDFYLLNKLAKVGQVVSLEAPVLTIAGRASHRVPFGTGPALSKLRAMTKPEIEYRYYHPDIFVALKGVLQTVDQAEQGFTSVAHFYQQLDDEMSKGMAIHTQAVLGLLNIEKAFRHLAGNSGKAQFKRAFHTWFDGFITLRFVHLMRDQGYPDVLLREIDGAC